MKNTKQNNTKTAYITKKKILIYIIIIFVFILLYLLYLLYSNYNQNNKYNKYNKINTNITNEYFSNGNNSNLVFTSAGDNTQFYNHWLGEGRKYDVWCVYYGNNDDNYNMYEKIVDKIWRRKGSKFQNFHYVYTNYRELLDKYDRFFIVDDDIIINTNDINNLFDISIKYDLWVCQSSFTPESKISAPYLNRVIDGNFLRYVNFIEVGVPVFSKPSLLKFMEYYDPILIGWGIDNLYMWVLGIDKPDKYAIIDCIQCINPHDNQKQNTIREHENIQNHNKEQDFWLQIQKKYNIPDWPGNQTFLTIPLTDENHINTLKLGIQTVFILKENLPFLREWIIYHLHIGFDKIFLYDNTGSMGHEGTNEVNKYAFNFNNIINMDEDLVNKELQSILNDFKDNIIYVKWQPKNKNGNIFYGQDLAIKHYINNYKDITDFTAYIDIDEFIFSANNTNLKDYIYNLHKDKNVTKLVINQKKFFDKFCNKELKNVSDITSVVENIDTSGWAPKNIVKNTALKNDESQIIIHSIDITNGNSFDVPIDTFRFNHYNVNKKQIEWMKGFYNKTSINDFTYGNDDSFKRYSDIINSKCNNKCSNKNKFINIDEINKEYDNLCISKL